MAAAEHKAAKSSASEVEYHSDRDSFLVVGHGTLIGCEKRAHQEQCV